MSRKDLFYGDVEGRMEESLLRKKKKQGEKRLTRAFQSCSDL